MSLGLRPLVVVPALLGVLAGNGELAVAQSRSIVVPESGGRAVGLAVAVSAGTAWELRSETGISYLAAHGVAEELRPALEGMGGSIGVECDLAGTRVTVLLPATGWEPGVSLFFDQLFGGDLSDQAIERARQRVLRELYLTESADATEIERALGAAIHGAESRWARPPCGTTATINSIRPSSVQRVARTRFTPQRTVAALVGAVEIDRGQEVLGRYIPTTDLPILLPVPRRVMGGVDRNSRSERRTVTAWLGMAFDFGGDTEIEVVRLLGMAITEMVGPSVARPEIYDVRVEVVRHGGGGSLVVYLATAPDQAAQWLERVETIVREFGSTPLDGPVFDRLLRRFLGRRLLELETPEARAGEAVLQLYFGEGFRPTLDRIESITPVMLQQTAAGLAEPAIAELGPR